MWCLLQLTKKKLHSALFGWNIWHLIRIYMKQRPRHFCDLVRDKDGRRTDEKVLDNDPRNIASLSLCSNCASWNTMKEDENSMCSMANNERVIKRCSVRMTEAEIRCGEAGTKTNLGGDTAGNLNEVLFSSPVCCIFYVAWQVHWTLFWGNCCHAIGEEGKPFEIKLDRDRSSTEKTHKVSVSGLLQLQ